MSLTLAPGVARSRRAAATPARPWPQPCGTLTTPRIIASVISTGSSIAPRAVATRARRRRRRARAPRRRRGGSAACSAAGPFTSRSLLCIHELLLRRWRRPISTRPRRRGAARRARAAARSREVLARREVDLACRRVPSRSGSRGSSGPRSRPCGARAASRATARRGRAVRAGAQPEVEDRLGAELAEQRRAASAPADRAERQPRPQREADLPVVARVGARARTAAASTSRRCAPRTR